MTKMRLPRWLGGRSTTQKDLPILAGSDSSILEIFRREGRGVVWERQQPQEIKQYINLLATKYWPQINELDRQASLWLDVENADMSPALEGERKPIPVVWEAGRKWETGKTIYLDDIFPGTADEKRAYLTDIEARARDAARLFGAWRRHPTAPLLMLTRTERKEPFPLHPHSYPVMALNQTPPCTVDKQGKELFSVGSVGIIEPGRLHRSPHVPPMKFRLYNALCYLS